MRRRISALVVLAIITAGCGSDEEPRPATKNARTTSAPSLGGTYERRLTRADIERTDQLRGESSANQDKPRPGRLELALEEDTLTMTDVGAGVTIRQDFSATSDGAFRIGAYQAPDEGSFCGPEVSQTASYAWKRSGDVLSLDAEHDECADRDSILSGQWERR
jgi:hypothetical protein